jgi:hypothetical protein
MVSSIGWFDSLPSSRTVKGVLAKALNCFDGRICSTGFIFVEIVSYCFLVFLAWSDAMRPCNSMTGALIAFIAGPSFYENLARWHGGTAVLAFPVFVLYSPMDDGWFK